MAPLAKPTPRNVDVICREYYGDPGRVVCANVTPDVAVAYVKEHSAAHRFAYETVPTHVKEEATQ